MKKIKQNFMRDNYAVVKEFISYDMANLAYTYFQNKRTSKTKSPSEMLKVEGVLCCVH